MRSIQARLILGLVPVLVILFVVQWAMVSYAIRHLTEDEFLYTRLRHDAESLLAALNILPDGSFSVPADRVAAAYQRPFSGHYFHIEVAGRDLHSRSLWDEDLPLQPVSPGQSETQFTSGPLQQLLMVYVAGFRKQGQDVVIAVAHDISDLESDIRELQWAYGAISLLALLLLIGIQVLTIRRGLRPAETARRQLQAIEAGELRELDTEVPLEIRPLVLEINRLLAMQTKRLQRSRNALGNLAHGLKAPLAVMNQLLGDARLQGHGELRQMLAQQVEIMRQLTERELKRARLASGGVPGQRFRPRHDTRALLDMFENIYRDKGLDYHLEVEASSPCALEREDMLELLGNLIDNASKWARSRVWVRLRAGGELVLSVEDDGPGVDEMQRARLARRGVRIDESRAGHGLGLAIVSDTVRDYGGSITFGCSAELGGFAVTVRLPCRSAV